MNPVKLSMITALLGFSVGIQQINDAIESSQNILLRDAQHKYEIVGNNPICVSGFPEVSEEHNEFEFKIFHGHARAFGFNEIKLIVLAYDSDQAQRLVDLFTSEYDKYVRQTRPTENGAVSYMFEDDISPNDVISYTNKSGSIYTLFNEQIFT